MNLTPSLKELLRPSKYQPVRELVAAAGVDVSDWAFDRDTNALDNPNANVYRSFMWSFGGNGEPTVLCIWHDEIDWGQADPTYSGNTRRFQNELDKLGNEGTAREEKQRLRIKLKRARAFQNAVYECNRKRLPIRAIILSGNRVDAEQAAKESSAVKARLLDEVDWYAHSYDPVSTEYQLVRGVLPPPPAAVEPYADVVDPGGDEEFQDYVGCLSESERESLIKARVGQGPFRDALIRRWNGCSVTGCHAIDLLVASHIKPWSRCETLAERLGDSNGLLLTPNLDKAFDRGLISFDDRYRVVVSPKLRLGVAMQLGIDPNLQLRSPRGDDLLPYLRWHRENVLTLV